MIKILLPLLAVVLAGCSQNARRGHSLFDKFHEDDLDQGAHKTHEMTVFEKVF